MKATENIAKQIAEMPLDPEYKYDPNVPIPLGKGVLVKKINQSNLITTDNLILVEGDNTRKPHIGIIQSVGPACSEYLKVGLRCYYNFFVDSSFYLDGVNYAKMDEPDVYYLIPPKTIVFERNKQAKEVRREKSIERSDDYIARKHKSDMNEKDKKQDKTKGKTFAIHFKPKNK